MENGVSNGGPQTDLTSRVLGRPPKEMSGALWFALGSFTSFVIPFFGVVMMGYGARELLEARGSRGFLFAGHRHYGSRPICQFRHGHAACW